MMIEVGYHERITQLGEAIEQAQAVGTARDTYDDREILNEELVFADELRNPLVHNRIIASRSLFTPSVG